MHIEPVQTENEQLTEALRTLGERFGLGVHHIHISEVHGKQILTVHLDIEEGLQLEASACPGQRFRAGGFRGVPGLRAGMDPPGAGAKAHQQCRQGGIHP